MASPQSFQGLVESTAAAGVSCRSQGHWSQIAQGPDRFAPPSMSKVKKECLAMESSYAAEFEASDLHLSFLHRLQDFRKADLQTCNSVHVKMSCQESSRVTNPALILYYADLPKADSLMPHLKCTNFQSGLSCRGKGQLVGVGGFKGTLLKQLHLVCIKACDG